MDRFKTVVWGMATTAFFSVVAVFLLNSRDSASRWAGAGMAFWAFLCGWMLWRNLWPSRAERLEARHREQLRKMYAPPPQTDELPPSKNPRYRRLDNFVSMADVPVGAKDYDYQRQAIAELRARRGYPPEEELR